MKRLTSTRPDFTIGLFDDATEPYVFGFVKDVDFDVDGNVYVLDDRLNVLRVFSATGQFRYALGRSGRGPGEYVEPSAMTISRNGDVYVGDITRRLHIFAKTPQGHSVGRSKQTEVAIEDLCVIEPHIIAHARSLGRNELFFALDTTGGVVRAFGELYRSPNDYVNMEIGRGRIACAPNEGVIFYGSGAVVPEFRGYGVDGRLRWITRIVGYQPLDVIQPANAPKSMRVMVPARGFHRLQTAIYDGKGHFIIQIAFVSQAAVRRRLSYDRLYTFAVSAVDGRGALLGDGIPLIGADARDALLVLRNDPFPAIERRSFTTPQ